MRSTIHVAFQFLKNRFRSRLCIRNLPAVFVVAVLTVSVCLLFGGRYDKYEESTDFKAKLEPKILSGHSVNLLKTNVGESKPLDSPDVTHHYKDITFHTVLLKENATTTKSPNSVSTNQILLKSVSNLTLPSYNKLYSHRLLPIKGLLPRVLLMYDNCSVDSAKRLKIFLQSQRIDFDLFSGTKSRMLPPLSKLSTETDEVIGRYSLILSADVGFLLHRFTQAERQLLFDYCRAFNVSIISVTRTAFDDLKSNTQSNFTFGKHYVSSVKRTHMNHVKVDSRRQWMFTKGGVTVTNIPKSAHWVVFMNHALRQQDDSHGSNKDSMVQETTKHMSTGNHLSLEYLQKKVHYYDPNILVNLKYTLNNSQTNSFSCHTSPIALIDHGNIAPGAVVVLIGMDIRFWLTNLILLDMINTYTKPPILRFSMERWVMVDIDDIFVAPEGLRMTPDDVEALIAAQERFQAIIPGFKFNLGFCGYYYDKGSEPEQLGNQKLVKNANNFNWFGHVYNHFQPHNYNEKQLVDYMTKNVQFASTQGIPVVGNSYSVTPHHSGVYPIHQPLYDAWKLVWNVTMTTTEEYPHLYPNQLRRGFIYQGVMVVPRQTCKLYTHTYSYDTFKGGKEQLTADAEGGSVFTVLLHNPVNIFMTHVTNYAVDRLALHLFDRLFHFVQHWTNLKLVTGPPLTLGKRFFDIFPEDKMPIWTCPCPDKRHLEIWSASKNCSRLPSLIVIGPQKSGTTALYTYLKAHPSIVSNHVTQDHYEEVQFFSNNTLYVKGIEWYMNQFPYPDESQVLFEKSATYLTHLLAPQRVSSLLPKAKLIAILHDPVKRAYSWYQHMRAHNDPTALNYNFSQVIQATPQSLDKKLLSLRDHCLSPGRYHIHLSRWLKYYSYKQIFLVDGDELTSNPAVVMDRVQTFIQIERVMNYSKILRYNDKKGFHCLSVHGKFHCLGPSKGRHYTLMKTADHAYLEEFYRHDNLLLRDLLKKFYFHTPTWLT